MVTIKFRSSSMKRILVVGGGVTGSLTCAMLNRSTAAAASSSARPEVTVWEKSRGLGGRMSSTRHPSDPDCVADLGAQYVTATKEYREQHGTYYDELLSSGVLKPLSAASLDGARHKADDISYVAPAGMSSIAKHFMKDSCSDVKFGQKLSNLTMDGETWSATTESGESVSFDAVVLTQPAPQILELPGAVAEILASQSDVRAELEKVEYSSRFAIAVYYDGKQGYDGMLGGGGQVRARYTKDDPAIRYLALGNLKTDGATEENPSTLVVVVHTSVPFGNEHLERDKEEIGKIVESKLREAYPSWPTPSSNKYHKWRYSQVSRSYKSTEDNAAAAGCLLLNERPLLIAGGDSFTHSNFDGCVASAEEIVRHIESRL